MKKALTSCLLALVALAVLGCGDQDRRDTGGIAIVVSSFNGVPLAVSMNATIDPVSGIGFVQIDQIDLQSVVLAGGGSSLQQVELQAYEVTYRRVDAGTRVPPPLVESIFGIIPAGGTTTLDNLPVLGPEQLLVPPLSDLLFVNGALDTETGSDVITLELRVRFFGETLNGTDVASEPIRFSIRFVP
ncbi:MAG TPA: hypothetical protein VMT16_08455 [Thermoanaerobaculia bacterium]|nr:hypothetical protein [Thermoanaerobaculia bacterium]